jgi:hypothetical protein
MTALWNNVLHYFDNYQPGVTTNMSGQVTHTSLHPYFYTYFNSLTSSIANRVRAKWTGSKIIKYGADSYHLRATLSTLEESCPSF